MVVQIPLPSKLSDANIPRLADALNSEFYTDHVTIDAGALRFGEPMGLLGAGVHLRSFFRHRERMGLRTQLTGLDDPNEAHTYLMHVGFFEFVGVNVGKPVGAAPGGETYMPITSVPRPKFSPTDHSIQDWYHQNQECARHLVRILGITDRSAGPVLAYAWRELLRNAFEHTDVEECFVFGQRYKGRVELVIADEGRGIANSLGECYPDLAPEDSLRMALLPGVSRTNNMTDSANIYDNSGFGLFVLSQLGLAHGSFTLASTTGRLHGRHTIQYANASFPGTLFGLEFVGSLDDAPALLNDILRAGDAEAASGGRGASRASKSLKV